MKVGVKVLPKPEVLDSQGRAVERTLKSHSIDVSQCVVGRYVVLDIDANNEDEARSKASEIAEFVLYNPLIETYHLEMNI